MSEVEPGYKWPLIICGPAVAFALLVGAYQAGRKASWEETWAKVDAVQRPYLDQLCASYFQWSATMKDRVPGMEKQCAGALPLKEEG